jgi:uncharacterized membrane protein
MSSPPIEYTRWQKATIVVFTLIVLICICVVGYNNPVQVATLLLVIAFAWVILQIIHLGDRRMSQLASRNGIDSESRIDTIVVGTILIVVVLI